MDNNIKIKIQKRMCTSDEALVFIQVAVFHCITLQFSLTDYNFTFIWVKGQISVFPLT